jgi:biopolymer transport protein ExbB
MSHDVLNQIAASGMCWIILTLALVCYQQLALRWLTPVSELREGCEGADCFIPTMIAALPLLGLLGTIMGLLDCFAALASGQSGADLFSAGIGDALLTTQLGLLCALPAWLLHSSLTSRINRSLSLQAQEA